MKSAILDINFSEAHISFNTEFIKAISHHSDILIVDDNESYGATQKTNYLYVKAKLIYKSSKSSILSRIFWIINFIKSYKSIYRLDIDKIFFLNHDIVVLFLCLLFVRNNVKKSIYLIHHKHIDELNNPIKLRLFNSYKNQVNHIVLADYIKDHMINHIKIIEKIVFVCKHPIYDGQKKIFISNSKKPATFIALSSSNDERVIDEIVNYSRLDDILKEFNITLYIKSKHINHTTTNLIVFNNYLDRERYNSLLNNCSGILLLLDDTFEYRVSGAMIDALSQGKIVISTNIASARYYRNDYPNMVRISNNIDDLILQLTKYDLNKSQLEENYRSFRIENSLSNLSKQFKYIFEE